MQSNRTLLASFVASLIGLNGCVSENGHKPDMADLPSHRKGQTTWQPATPADLQPKEAWWQRFNDPELNRLEQDCQNNNATLKIALAHLAQAQAQAGVHAAASLPTIGLSGSATRTRISTDRPLTNYSSTNSTTVQNDIKPTLTVSYELDWLGRVRQDTEAARASAAQSQADSENVRLLLSAQLASAYFQLREQDEEANWLQHWILVQQNVLELTRVRHELGVASAADTSTQEDNLHEAQVQRQLLLNQRQQQEDLLATLSGHPAADFHLSPGTLPASVPAIPAGIPATLLQRRPDIASAERAMAVANAQMGVAKTAWFPQLTLTPTYGGYESNTLSELISAPAAIWSFGLQASQTLFDNGKTRRNIESAEAGYTAATATYRQTVLQAIQESQDALSTLQGLQQAEQQEQRAVANKQRNYSLSQARYQDGLDNALTLAVSQQAMISTARLHTQIRGNQFVWSVNLLKALGGDWQTKS